MKIKETLEDAFGDRFFGFSMLALLPAAFIIVQGFQQFGVIIVIPAILYVLLWLIIIRMSL